ncbi:TNF receptor-associated factor 5-like isoform X2 [Acropora muricata]|uniref:TNF receptor-associated factor 5-like isoform X2 n=1 Tax=Acropora millepora TaxID=45264 RepID=UPI001CF5D954|nr:TNF receptor-associated factor 5-like isoform X2 [Acropora millepora]
MMEEEFEGEPIIGGYQFVFVDKLSTSQTCPICLFAMRKPVQTVCGHRFCESCLLETFREGRNPPICPEDRNPFPEDDKGVFRDVAWERDILSLRVKCKKSKRGCDWTGQLRYYEKHLLACNYEDVTCDVCNEKMHRRLLDKHIISECLNRMVQCEFCEKTFAFCHTERHEDNECTRFPENCPQECGEEEIPREEVESHVRDDCVMTMVHCTYQEAGCTFYDKRRNLKIHLDVSMEEHLSGTWSKLLKTTERLNKLKEVEVSMHRLVLKNERMNAEITDLRLEVGKSGELRNDMEKMRRLYKKNEDKIHELRRIVQSMESKVTANEENVPGKPKKRNRPEKKKDDSKNPARKK